MTIHLMIFYIFKIGLMFQAISHEVYRVGPKYFGDGRVGSPEPLDLE